MSPTQLAPLNSSETQSQLIVRLLNRGGKILVAGGETKDLPERITRHPQIIIWDDNQQNVLHKSVPSNVRAIIYNRWVSHAIAGQLREAAGKLGVPVFPMLRTREIKVLLSEVVQEVATVAEADPIIEEPVIEVPLSEPTTEPQGKGFITAEELMRPVKRGETKAILDAELKPGESGTIAMTERLMPIIRSKYHISMTPDALRQAVIKYRTNEKAAAAARRPTTVNSQPATKAKIKVHTDDFVEVEKLLRDAKTAIDLALEFIPKVRKRVELLEARRQKLIDLLGGGEE